MHLKHHYSSTGVSLLTWTAAKAYFLFGLSIGLSEGLNQKGTFKRIQEYIEYVIYINCFFFSKMYMFFYLFQF